MSIEPFSRPRARLWTSLVLACASAWGCGATERGEATDQSESAFSRERCETSARWTTQFFANDRFSPTHADGSSALTTRDDLSVHLDNAPDTHPALHPPTNLEGHPHSIIWSKTQCLKPGEAGFILMANGPVRLDVDGQTIYDGGPTGYRAIPWRSDGRCVGISVRMVSPDGQPSARLDWNGQLNDDSVPPVSAHCGGERYWHTEYFSNTRDYRPGQTPTATADDVTAVNFDWGDGAAAPVPSGTYLLENHFVARFTREGCFDEGWHEFTLDADDWIDLKIGADNVLPRSDWEARPPHTSSMTRRWYSPGGCFPIEVLYGEQGAAANVNVGWKKWQPPPPPKPPSCATGSRPRGSQGTCEGGHWLVEHWKGAAEPSSARAPGYGYEYKDYRGQPNTVFGIHENWQNPSNAPFDDIHPSYGVPQDTPFATRFTRNLEFSSGGCFTFRLEGDDGARFKIDDGPWVVDAWGNGQTRDIRTVTRPVRVERGTRTFVVEHVELGGGAGVRLNWWRTPGACAP